MGMHITVEASDRIQAIGIQVHGWRAGAKCAHGGRGRPLGSRVAFSIYVVAESWAGCLPDWIPGFGRGWERDLERLINFYFYFFFGGGDLGKI